MQKHNEWLSNKGYLRHLQVLNQINSRKTHRCLNKTSPLHDKAERTTVFILSSEHKDQAQQSERNLIRSINIRAIKNQQIQWDNYLIGKRIIQTPSVISKKKMDEQYRRHRKIIDNKTASSCRKSIPTDFRVKKLQQYKENVEQYQQNKIKTQGMSKNIIKITIKVFFREKYSLDNLSIIFFYNGKSGKKYSQEYQGFPAYELIGKHLYFGISKRLVNNQNPLSLEIRNIKGLNMQSIGYISFPSSVILTNYKCQLFHYGKLIGEVLITTQYETKDNI